jgi:hypothetical protein
MSGFSPRAILLGTVAAFLAGGVCSVVAAALAMPSAAQLDPAVNPMMATTTLVAMSLAGAVISAFVAGWVAAQLARNAELLNAVAVGALLVLLSALFFLPLGMETFPLWYNVPAFALTIPFSLLGGLVRRWARYSA